MKHKAHHERMFNLSNVLGERVLDLAVDFENKKASYYNRAYHEETVEGHKSALEDLLFAFYIRSFIGNSLRNGGKDCLSFDEYVRKYLPDLVECNPVFKGDNNTLAAKASKQLMFEYGLLS